MSYALFFMLGLPLSASRAASADDPVVPNAPTASQGAGATGAVDASAASNVPLHPRITRSGTARVPRAGGPGTLEERVRFFTSKLDLDVTQQAKLRKILTDQREAVRKIWSNPMLSPAERAPATLAANQRTGEEIRSILNDAQRQKYNPPAPTTPAPPGDKRTVEDWLDLTRPR